MCSIQLHLAVFSDAASDVTIARQIVWDKNVKFGDSYWNRLRLSRHDHFVTGDYKLQPNQVTLYGVSSNKDTNEVNNI